LLSEEDQVIASSSMYRKLGETWTRVFEMCERSGKRTHRQTDVRIEILRNEVTAAHYRLDVLFSNFQ